MDSPQFTRACLLWLCLGAAAGAVASEQPVTLPLPADEPALVQFVVPDAEGGFTLYLEDGGLLVLDAQDQLVRQSYLPELEVRASAPLSGSPPSFLASRTGHHVVLRITPGALSPGTPSGQVAPASYCRLRRIDDSLDVRLIDGQLQPRVIKHARGVDAEDGVWLLLDDGSVIRHGRDCRVDSSATVVTPILRMVADRHAAAVHLLDTGGRVQRIDSSGIAWTRVLPDYAGYQSQLPGLDIAADGDILVTYVEGTDFASTVMRLGPDGTPRWRNVLDRTMLISHMETIGNSALLVESSSVFALDAAGQMAWSATESRLLRESLPQPPASNMSWLRFANHGGQSIESTVAFTETSGPAREWILPAPVRAVSGLADGGLLAWEPQSAGLFSPGLVLLRGLSDAAAQLQPIELPARRSGHRFGNAMVDEHGILAVTWDGRGWHLSALDHDLELRWLARQDRSHREGQPTYELAANEEHACVLARDVVASSTTDNSLLKCFDRNNGSELFPPLALVTHEPALRMLPDGRAEVLFGEKQGPHQLRRLLVASDGSLEEPRRPFASAQSTLHRLGSAAPFGTAHWALVWSDSLGRQTLNISPFDDVGPQATLPISDAWGDPHTAIDPSVTLATHLDRVAVLSRVRDFDTPGVALSVFSRAGQSIWLRSFPQSASSSRSGVIAIDQGWLLLRSDGPDVRLAALALDSGEVLWERQASVPELDADGFARPDPQAKLKLLPDPSGTRFGLAAELPSATRITWYAADNGDPLATVTTPVRIDGSSALAVGGQEHLLIAGSAPAGSEPAPAMSHVDPRTRERTDTLAIDRLRGAWFDPALSGQGLLVEALPAQNLLFAAWFTFSEAGGHQSRELRWYTLQGDLSSAATAGVGVFGNSGGAFASPPATTAEQLGSARLHLGAEDRLQLHYRMQVDGEGTLDGALDLIPLLPAHGAPGPLLWFDPATAGQGLVLSAPLGAAPVVFAGWFTFDPEGRADDPNAHHWFTLQGDYQAAASGAVQVQIVRTVGGRLGVEGTGNSHRVGHATLTPQACDRLRLEYAFEQDDLAGAFAGLTGSLQLRSLSACTP